MERMIDPIHIQSVLDHRNDQIKSMLRFIGENKKIEAIRMYRILTFASLLEAKNAIELAMVPRNKIR